MPAASVGHTSDKAPSRKVKIKTKKWDLKGQCHEIFTPGFFLQTVPPGPRRHAQKRFRFFSIIHRDIRLFRCFAGVNDTGKWHFYCFWELHQCQRHRQKITHRCRHASPVSLIPGSKYRQLRPCQWHRQCMHCRCRWHCWCTSTTFGSSFANAFKGTISKKTSRQWILLLNSVH